MSGTRLSEARRLAVFTVFTAGVTGLGAVLNCAEGHPLNVGQSVTWGLGLLTGLIIGSLAERKIWR